MADKVYPITHTGVTAELLRKSRRHLAGPSLLGYCQIDASLAAFTTGGGGQAISALTSLSISTEYGDHDVAVVPIAGTQTFELAMSGDPSIYLLIANPFIVFPAVTLTEIVELDFVFGIGGGINGMVAVGSAAVQFESMASNIVVAPLSATYPFTATIQVNSAAGLVGHGGAGPGSDWGLSVLAMRFALPGA